MATGLGRSQVGASDIVYDFACTPCAHDAKNTEAVYHCSGCDVYFCLKCVEFHRKLFISHTENEISSQNSWRSPAKQRSFQDDMCNLHPEEAIKMFCGEHDVVCCTVCICLYHRPCKGVEYIPSVAGHLLQRHEIEKTRQELENVKENLQALKISRVKDLYETDTEKEQAIKDADNIRRHIIARATVLEKATQENIRKTSDAISNEIKVSIACIDKSLKAVDEELHRISQIPTDKVTRFIRVKQGQRQVLNGTECYEQNCIKKVKSISFKMHGNLEAILFQSDLLGHVVVEDTDIRRLAKANFIKEYDLRIDSDENTSLIYDMCRLESNHLIVTDSSNNKLKRLDENFKVIDHIRLSCGPRSVCAVGRSKVAVTLCDSKMVVFVSVGQTLTPGESFDVDEYCRGICFRQDKLYICCGGHPKWDERPGHINVYNMTGSIIESFELTGQGYGKDSFPLGIVSSSSGSKVFVADAVQGLLAIDAESQRKDFSVKDKRFKCTTGVCKDNHKHLFVCNGKSNNVMEIDEEGNVLQEILTYEDGIEDPLWVILLQNPKRLLVTCRNSSKIKVFYLS